MTDAAFASGVIAVVRFPQAAPTDLRAVAAALVAGGVTAVEITLTTPGALQAIGDLASDDGVREGAYVLGAGTVLDERSAREVIAAGARFVVSPTLDRTVMRYCRDRNVPYLPGALTPTELLEARRAGAHMVKLFPASLVGPRYVREILAPLPFLRLVPSGGVALEGAGDWIRAGAAAVSVGSALVSASLVRDESWAEVTARARALVESVAAARRQLAGAPA
ncbi:MAG: 2-dehydro-3-deoxyphosphogluconate aldolase [Gemmatimonadetes bacterium]|nr:MAG: 2-dehydro-3-deoxyphosphogluconate aldolase [Gemmatimonadota bacterium]